MPAPSNSTSNLCQPLIHQPKIQFQVLLPLPIVPIEHLGDQNTGRPVHARQTMYHHRPLKYRFYYVAAGGPDLLVYLVEEAVGGVLAVAELVDCVEDRFFSNDRVFHGIGGLAAAK